MIHSKRAFGERGGVGGTNAGGVVRGLKLGRLHPEMRHPVNRANQFFFNAWYPSTVDILLFLTQRK